MKILVIDGSDGNVFYNVVNKYSSKHDIILQANMDISFRSVKKDFYDVIVSYGVTGRTRHEDLPSCLRSNKSVNRPVVICIDRNPRTRAILDNELKPYKHYVLDVDQTNVLDEIMTYLSK